MRSRFGIFVFMLASVLAVHLLALPANAQGTSNVGGVLTDGSLSCTYSTLVSGLGGPLPSCMQNGISTLDSVTFWVSATCTLATCPQLSLALIQINPPQANIGLSNGPCSNGVAWQLSGGAASYGSATEYIYGIITGEAFGYLPVTWGDSVSCVGPEVPRACRLEDCRAVDVRRDQEITVR